MTLTKQRCKNIEIYDWVIQELENWSRWCWRGEYPHPLPPKHCASLEWQYERIREEGEIESVDAKPIPINEFRANIVQGVYESLPTLQSQVLRAEYPQRHSSVRKHLQSKIGKASYDAALNTALFRVMVAFDKG